MEEFDNIIKNFKFDEVEPKVNLDDTKKSMISLVVLTTLGTVSEIPFEVSTALKRNVKPEALSEAIIQCAPYVGYTKVKEALNVLFESIEANGINLPLDNQSNTTKEDRFDKGLIAQGRIFGDEMISKMRASAPEDLKHIQDYLSAYCFGDFYTRKTIDLTTRELLTFCILSALSDCESQLKSHIFGNLSQGNTKEVLIAAITWCLPYIGFPRTLNVINSINEVMSKK
jgi:4-carboxymuconolactone decarboxylase